MKNPLTHVHASSALRARAHVFVIALLGIGLITATSGCGFVQRFGKKSDSANTGNTIPDEKILHLDQFVVNLADPGSDAFLRVGIDVGVRSTSPAISANGVDPATVGLVRDTILKIITTRTSADLLTPQGKDELKSMLLAAIQKRDPGLGATAIYFTDFLVQR